MRKKLLELLKKDAFFEKKVKLSSGKISNYYVDVRRVSLSPQGVYLISNLIWKIIKNLDIDAVGGPTLGADPLVSGVCYIAYKNKKDIKGFLIRKTPKKHGGKKMIEGQDIKAGERVMLFDDVATSGGSIVESIEILKNSKVKVIGAVTVIDREEGAKEALSKIGCPLFSLFTKSDFLEKKNK